MVFSSSYGNWPNTRYHLSPQTSSHFQNHQIFKRSEKESFFFPPFRQCKEDGAMLFSVVLSARVIGNEHQPEYTVPFEHQEGLLYCAGTEHSYSPSTVVMDSTFLEIFRSCMAMVPDNLLWMALLEQEVGPNGFRRYPPTSTILQFSDSPSSAFITSFLCQLY